jgi:hypothetical protein
MRVVDSMHDPLKRIDPMQNITEEQTVFMDEDDSSLYFSGSDGTHTIYNHENVFYKFTHCNETVYSKSEVAGA